MAATKQQGLVERLLEPLDERVNLKLLQRVWGPRVEFGVRLMLVATFLDDALRTATDFSEHAKQVGEKGCLAGLAATSPELVGTAATAAVGLGLLAQALGSLCLLALIRPHGATKALIGWAIAQPVLYAQTSNLEFVAESLSLVGGLLMLRAHLVSEQARRDPLSGGGLDGAAQATVARTQLLGRLLLPAVYLYHAGSFLNSALTLDETNSLAMYAQSLSMFAVNVAALVGLVLGGGLVAAGLKSRTVALSLALLNLAFVCYQHPFFHFIWLEGGEWKYNEAEMRASMPQVALPTDVTPLDFQPSQIYDLHRYYFFQGLSTSGALLLLAQFGPGEMAVEKDEVLLPVVQRAQD